MQEDGKDLAEVQVDSHAGGSSWNLCSCKSTHLSLTTGHVKKGKGKIWLDTHNRETTQGVEKSPCAVKSASDYHHRWFVIRQPVTWTLLPALTMMGSLTSSHKGETLWFLKSEPHRESSVGGRPTEQRSPSGPLPTSLEGHYGGLLSRDSWIAITMYTHKTAIMQGSNLDPLRRVVT